jgi:AraC-like DNA-binding protein
LPAAARIIGYSASLRNARCRKQRHRSPSVVCRLFLHSPRRIVDVAIASGFHDQAHMVHEWHLLAGCTPQEWILGQLPFLQDYEIGGGHD